MRIHANVKASYLCSLFCWLQYLTIVLMCMPVDSVAAEESLCARVKIEIKQELTLERQAFDAHMRINNGLTHVSLEDINVDVLFTDEEGARVLASSDPDDTDALFYIRVDTIDNIDNVSGTGSVEPASSADIHWLIIPAPGASNGLEFGTLYNVGAILTYTIGGEENITEVTPDYIFVKPMPELLLDYFLPSEVYGDDPFTSEIEPEIPFSLGVRVKNSGAGGAKNLKIDSAQPKIVENEQGLLINFFIHGSEVNGQAATESLLVDFGTIAPTASGMARWRMTCSLSGRFVEFDASFSHADELGGELTSLIGSINTHFLVRDVLVDLPGRDGIRDFLAKDGDVYRVYESDSEDTVVTDQSELSGLVYQGASGTETLYTLSAPATAGFMFIKLSDPHHGEKLLRGAIRSDGKEVKPENVWLSKTQDRDDHTWMHFVNVFDANNTGSYTLVFDDSAAIPQAPVMQYIPDRSRTEGSFLSFIVEASDPNGTIPTLSAEPLPVGASFVDKGDGTAIFEWTPEVGQKGRYGIAFTASDGTLTATRRAKLTICDIGDTDMDGMLDSWEVAFFGTLDRDGTGDFDGDGISDLQEFLDGTDPLLDESVPSIPEPLYPNENEDVADVTPELIIESSTDAQADEISYEFEIYADEQMTDMVASQLEVAEAGQANGLFFPLLADTSGTQLPAGVDTKSWVVPSSLADNNRYYWRVRSSDGDGSSLWAYWNFFVNTQNDPPQAFNISSPSDASEVDTARPVLQISNSCDIDNNILVYTFEVFEDPDMTSLVTSGLDIPEASGGSTSWTVTPALSDTTWYYWRCIATDEHGARTETPAASFYVNTANHAPSAPTILTPGGLEELDTLTVMLTVQNAVDADSDPLDYIFEIDTMETFDSANRASSGIIPESAGTTGWGVENLSEDTAYFWRVKAHDGAAESPWVSGRFFVNRINHAPGCPTIKNPGENAWTDARTPVLSVHAAADPDKDTLFYRFEIYANAALTRFVMQGESNTPDWTVDRALKNNTRYFWRVQTVDEHGVASAWSTVSDFFVKIDVVNQAPEVSFVSPSEEVVINASDLLIQWTDADPDSNAVVSLYYDTDPSGEDGILIADGLPEDLDDASDQYTWDISELADGTYYLYAVIQDEDTRVAVYASAAVTVDRMAPILSIDPAPGIYYTAQVVTLFANEPGQIHFTVDGSIPTETSAIYAEPIEITENTLLKAVAIDMAGNTSNVLVAEYVFGEPNIIFTVTDDNGEPLSGIKAYVFTETNAYTGKYAVTDSEGHGAFTPDAFTAGTYKFRVDYLGHQFWSEPVTLPDTLRPEMVIPVETAQVHISTANGPAGDVKVYLFSETGSYLGAYQKADADGLVTFELPEGVMFKFRADILGSQYWSSPTAVEAGATNNIALETGGGLMQVILQKEPGHPIPGVKLYLFSETGSYLGKYGISDQPGQVAFAVPEAVYKVRADYLGYQFWTDPVFITTDTTIEHTVPHKDVTVSVRGVFQEASDPIAGIKVYLFNETNAYLGSCQITDASGTVSFSLPEARSYKVRADYLGAQFWSETFIGQDAAVNIAMADCHVTVTGSGLPQENVKVYLFSETGAYLGRYQTTDENGQVFFRIPEGRYKFRADYQSSQYWSAVSPLAAHTVNPVDLSVGGGSFTYTVQKAPGEPIVGTKCHVFTDAGSYIGFYGVTNENGQAFFDLADGGYRFRVDFLGEQFWSDTIQVPDALSAELTLGHETANVTVFTGNGPAREAKVYLFSESDAYLGLYQSTDDSGQATFNLPVGVTYKFRADVLGSRYWSAPTLMTGGGPNPVDIATGGGLFQVALQKDPQTPMAGIKLCLFNDTGSYLGQYQITGFDGVVSFEVPEGSYKVRADYLGYQFWTAPEIVTDDTTVAFPLPHQDTGVAVSGSYQDVLTPLEGIKVHLFNATGTYVGEYRHTDSTGQVTFSLPETGYTVRADFMGRPFWSDTFTWANTPLTIPMAEAAVKVTGAGLPENDVKVYVFSPSGAYLGLSATTDETGQVTFMLPAGDYQFRADYQGSQFWTANETLLADLSNPVILSVGGGSFTLHVKKTSTAPLTGVKTYVFNQNNAYLGLAGATSEAGETAFDLADGSYKFRVDYVGYPFWSSLFTVPGALSGELFLNHQDCTLTLTGTYLDAAALGEVTTYLFTSQGSYVGRHQKTDADGIVTFSLPDAAYKIRVDYLGEKYWTPSFQAEDIALDIPHGAAKLRVQKDGAGVESAKVYLFGEGGNYLGRYLNTDASGMADFTVPSDRNYLFRVDAEGVQVWSEVLRVAPAQVSEQIVTIP